VLQVTPNSQIYFYQLTAAGQNASWTGRFTIAGADGSSTDPTESGPDLDLQGKPVLWGKGALVDPSAAIAAPTFDTDNSTSASGLGPSNSASVTPSSTSGVAKTPSKSSSGSSGASKSSNPSVSGSAPQNSGSSAAIAVGPMALDTRIWPFVTALTASTMAFTILL